MPKRPIIIATIGPASAGADILAGMIREGLDIARFNFAWSNPSERREHINTLRDVARTAQKSIPILADLPGPRVQKSDGHTYDASAPTLTKEDEQSIRFCVEEKIEYIALSFVGSAADVERARMVVKENGGTQKIIAKIERKIAVENIDEILLAADAIMVARGDLGSEVLLEDMPFIEMDLIQKANTARKPVIVATGLLASMVGNPEPARAEVTDVAEAVMHGADMLMLSDETAAGKHPVLAVAAMRRIIEDAQMHMESRTAQSL